MPRYEEGWGSGPRRAGNGEAGGWMRDRFDEVGHSREPLGGRGGEDWFDGGRIYGPERYGLGPYHERLRRRRRPDAEVKEGVEEALFLDTWVDADAITVAVSDGIVTLRGALPDYDEIRYATDDAWDVEGVLGVRSELTVR